MRQHAPATFDVGSASSDKPSIRSPFWVHRDKAIGPSVCRWVKRQAGSGLRRFLKKNLPFQDVGAGLIKMSYLGNAGWRCNRASTAGIAALPSEMPLLYTLRLSLTTG